MLSNKATRRAYDVLRDGGGARVACAKLLRVRGAHTQYRLGSMVAGAPDGASATATPGGLGALLAEARGAAATSAPRQPQGETPFELALRLKNWSLAAAIGLPLPPHSSHVAPSDPASRDAAAELRDRQQRSVLHHAVMAQDAHWVGKLVRLGADPRASDVFGTTPALLAAGLDNEQLLARLLKSSPASTAAELVQQADTGGQTPLIAAACSGDAHAVQFLLDMGAERSARDSAGHDAAYYATELMLDEVLHLLKAT